MVVRSAGTILYRHGEDGLRVLIAHMGGPFWARKDEHAWSIPKGEYADDEDPEAAARREFREEMGSDLPAGELAPLGIVSQSSGKKLAVYALEGDFDTTTVSSNTFELEWPPRSGRIQSFPEIDRAEWFDCATARTKLVKGQIPILDRLVAHLEPVRAEPDSAQSRPNR